MKQNIKKQLNKLESGTYRTRGYRDASYSNVECHINGEGQTNHSKDSICPMGEINSNHYF